MKAIIKQYSIILALFWLAVIFAMPTAVFCNVSVSQQKIATELASEFRNDGWSDLSFEVLRTDAISIRFITKQDKRLTDGELASALAAILKPDVVSKLKKAGFKKGIFIDSKSRKYSFNISTKYYNDMQATIYKLTGGR